MSWDQGIQPRDEMDAKAVEVLERTYRKLTGEESAVEYITWFGVDPDELIAHFASDRALRIKTR